MMRKVLITGCAGYIGSVLVRQLLEKGYHVRGMDVAAFGGESLLGIYNHPHFEFQRGDVRSREDCSAALAGMDSVVHLAAIVGDPACAKQPDLAREVNWTGSKLLYDLCNASPDVRRFVFSSTCSNYGKSKDDSYMNEESPLNPVSLYAELKVKFETYLLETPRRADLCATPLRFATVYGLSPRMRFDLTVNEFVRELTLGKELSVFGEQFWRPYAHVEDLARGCALVLESDPSKVSGKVFNVGDSGENYQKKSIAEEVLKAVPGGKVVYVQKKEDPRDYRVSFQKIHKELGFEVTRRLRDGIREICGALRNGIFRDPYSSRYHNTPV